MPRSFNEQIYAYLQNRVPEIKGTWQNKCDALRDEMKEKFNYAMNNGEQLRSLMRRISDTIERTKAISDAIPVKPQYEVVDGHYLIETKLGVFKLSIEDADEIFADFSKH